MSKCVLLILLLVAFLSISSLSKAESKPDESQTKVAYDTVDINDLNGKQKVIKQYAEVLAKLMDLANIPGVDVVTFFTDIIMKVVSSTKHDIWTNIERKVENRINNKITHNHFGTLVTLVKKLQTYMRPSIQLTVKDLKVHILPMKYQFLPQTFAYTSFNSKWTTALPAYMTYMTAAYLELIYEGKLDKCSLAKELQTIRAEAIQAAKALFRARYRAINGVFWWKAWPNWDCVGLQCLSVAWFKYEDGTTGQAHEDTIKGVPNIFGRIRQNTAEIVWKQLIKNVNVFFTKKVCLCEAECPKPIAWHEINFAFPSECYGKGNKWGYNCALPCYAYNSGYNWCPTLGIPHNGIVHDWDECKRDAGMLKCMPVKGTSVFDEVEAY